MNPCKYIKRIFQAKAAKKGPDFSSFATAAPLTRRQQLIEECKKQDVSTCIDDPSEKSAIFQGDASVAELERRLNAKKAIGLSKHANDLSKRANGIALFALIVSAIPLIKPFLLRWL